VQLATRRVGSGPMLVCHPGGPGFAGAELADPGGLDAARELVLVDPRGTGASPAPDDPGAYRTEDYAADLEELREELALETIDLLGFSHGGIVAMAYAAEHPTHVRKLVLASTIAAVTDDTGAEMARVKAAKAGEPWYDRAIAALEQEERGDYGDGDLAAMWTAMAPLYFHRWDERYRGWLATSVEGANAAPLRVANTQPFDLRADLPRIDAETLVVTGADDFICGPAAARTIAACIRGAETVILERAGHMTFVEQPDAFREAVEAFLAR
jgi:pimeloyl-ACP methyl ester carboxylesterase